MITVQAPSEGDHVLHSKAPEQLLNGPCGEILFSKSYLVPFGYQLKYVITNFPVKSKQSRLNNLTHLKLLMH